MLELGNIKNIFRTQYPPIERRRRLRHLSQLWSDGGSNPKTRLMGLEHDCHHLVPTYPSKQDHHGRQVYDCYYRIQTKNTIMAVMYLTAAVHFHHADALGTVIWPKPTPNSDEPFTDDRGRPVTPFTNTSSSLAPVDSWSRGLPAWF